MSCRLAAGTAGLGGLGRVGVGLGVAVGLGDTGDVGVVGATVLANVLDDESGGSAVEAWSSPVELHPGTNRQPARADAADQREISTRNTTASRRQKILVRIFLWITRRGIAVSINGQSALMCDSMKMMGSVPSQAAVG